MRSIWISAVVLKSNATYNEHQLMSRRDIEDLNPSENKFHRILMYHNGMDERMKCSLKDLNMMSIYTRYSLLDLKQIEITYNIHQMF